jgi:tryptophan-rich sensory protein
MNTWFEQLIKPSWAPPAWIFGPVWAFLYLIIAITFIYVGWLFIKGRIGLIVFLPFMLNLVFNLLFTTIQFRMQNNLLASIDILLVLGTLIWLLIAIYPHSKWVAFANLPYLLWVSFATVLQLTITYLNKN